MATVNNTLGREKFDLSIMYSRECNLECPHCMYDSSPQVKDRLDLEQLQEFISTWNERINSIGFYGGEPTLHLDAYHDICKMLPEGLQRWMISNGTWSRSIDESAKVIFWTLEHNVSPLIVSGTKYHVPHQNRKRLKGIAQAMPEHVWLKGEEDRYLPMGRLANPQFSCMKRCIRDQRPTRIAVQPDGFIIFQTCDGVYPIIGHMDEGFPAIAVKALSAVNTDFVFRYCSPADENASPADSDDYYVYSINGDI